ncbi:MAG: hypothetical protein ACSW8C_01985 [bacterium]
MSVPVGQILGNNESESVNEGLKYGEAKYNAWRELFTTLTQDDKYKAYFNQGAELDELQALLSQKLEELRTAIEGLYDETAIDALMEALGALLVGNDSNMGLEARIMAYIALLGAKDSITEDDYQALLSKLNSEEGITQTVFNQLLNFAKERKSAIDFLEKYAVFFEKVKEKELTYYNYYLTRLSEITLGNQNALDDLFKDIKKFVPDFRIEEIKHQNQTIRKTLAGVVLANEIQAKNVHKEVEGLLKEDQSLNSRAVFDENLKRLRDEGIWAEKSSNRRQEILQEEALQKAREAERKAKNENI